MFTTHVKWYIRVGSSFRHNFSSLFWYLGINTSGKTPLAPPLQARAQTNEERGQAVAGIYSWIQLASLWLF